MCTDQWGKKMGQGDLACWMSGDGIMLTSGVEERAMLTNGVRAVTHGCMA